MPRTLSHSADRRAVLAALPALSPAGGFAGFTAGAYNREHIGRDEFALFRKIVASA